MDLFGFGPGGGEREGVALMMMPFSVCVCQCVCVSRGLGRRIHGSVEDTKLSTNKQHSLSPHLQYAISRIDKK